MPRQKKLLIGLIALVGVLAIVLFLTLSPRALSKEQAEGIILSQLDFSSKLETLPSAYTSIDQNPHPIFGIDSVTTDEQYLLEVVGSGSDCYADSVLRYSITEEGSVLASVDLREILEEDDLEHMLYRDAFSSDLLMFASAEEAKGFVDQAKAGYFEETCSNDEVDGAYDFKVMTNLSGLNDVYSKFGFGDSNSAWFEKQSTYLPVTGTWWSFRTRAHVALAAQDRYVLVVRAATDNASVFGTTTSVGDSLVGGGIEKALRKFYEAFK
jgi:hypothetical protein